MSLSKSFYVFLFGGTFALMETPLTLFIVKTRPTKMTLNDTCKNIYDDACLGIFTQCLSQNILSSQFSFKILIRISQWRMSYLLLLLYPFLTGCLYQMLLKKLSFAKAKIQPINSSLIVSHSQLVYKSSNQIYWFIPYIVSWNVLVCGSSNQTGELG